MDNTQIEKVSLFYTASPPRGRHGTYAPRRRIRPCSPSSACCVATRPFERSEQAVRKTTRRPSPVLDAGRARERVGPEGEQAVVLPADAWHGLVVHGVACWGVENLVLECAILLTRRQPTCGRSGGGCERVGSCCNSRCRCTAGSPASGCCHGSDPSTPSSQPCCRGASHRRPLQR